MKDIKVIIIDGRPKGYITVEELAEKSNVDPQCIRANIHRGNLHPLTIGYGKWQIHWFPEEFIFEKRTRGRPKKENNGKYL